MSSFDVSNLFAVQGKVVLVTGGSRGIGKMISTGFVRNGATVYISSRSVKDCNVTAAELSTLGPGKCMPIPADLQKMGEVTRLVKELSSKENALHVLVNNAGAVWAAGIDDTPDASFTKVLTINLHRVFTLTQQLLPLLRAAAVQGGMNGLSYADPARIINIGSVEGLAVPDHETFAYSASKAGLHHLSRHLGGRLGWEGINSNTIACGPFKTKMTAQAMALLPDGMLAGNPSRRNGTPEDVAGTALFLGSRAGAYVNGATITLDGGHLVSMPSSKL